MYSLPWIQSLAPSSTPASKLIPFRHWDQSLGFFCSKLETILRNCKPECFIMSITGILPLSLWNKDGWHFPPWRRTVRITTVRIVQHSDTEYQLHRALGCNKKAQERKGHSNKAKWIIYNQLQGAFKEEPTEKPFRPVKSMEPSALDVSVDKV